MSKELDCRRKVDTVGKDVEAPLHAQGMCFTPLALQFVGKTTTPRLPPPLPFYMQAASGDYEYYSYKEVAEAVKALKSKEETKLLKELFSVYKKVNKDCVGRHGRGETPTNLNSADLASTAKAVAVKAVPVKAAAVKVAAVNMAAVNMDAVSVWLCQCSCHGRKAVPVQRKLGHSAPNYAHAHNTIVTQI